MNTHTILQIQLSEDNADRSDPKSLIQTRMQARKALKLKTLNGHICITKSIAMYWTLFHVE